MVLKEAERRTSPALRLLLWCLGGAVAVQFLLWRIAPGSPPANRFEFSPIFWTLLQAFDGHGNLLAAAIALFAWIMRRHPSIEAFASFAAERPWALAGGAFVALAAASLLVGRGYPLSMDEYAAAFQAEAFASGHLAGRFPPELLDQLMPRFPRGFFFTVSQATGEVSGGYWPGFALVLTPFAWLGIPWAANPALSALTLPLVHRLALALSGSREAAGWAALFTLASPVFVANALSFYSMPAHLLCNAAFVVLLLQPTVARALAAGLVGSFALTLHNPAPHLLFAPAIVAWLLWRRTPLPVLATLVAGYLPLALLVGVGWQQHLASLTAGTSAAASAAATGAAGTAAAGAPAPSLPSRLLALAASALTLPGPRILEARIAGLTKLWTWSGALLLVLAAWGYGAMRRLPEAHALAATLLVTFVGFLFVPFDQGHGWGFRYLHSAWFVLPVFAGIALCRLPEPDATELRQMAGWAVFLSLVLANGLRLAQVDSFLERHLAQVPPLAQPTPPGRQEILFVDPDQGAYLRDMVRNDPLLRGPRLMMVYDGRQKTAALMAERFPAYTRRASGKWGEQWMK